MNMNSTFACDVFGCLFRFFQLLAESWQLDLNTVQSEWVLRSEPKIWRKVQKFGKSVDFQDFHY